MEKRGVISPECTPAETEPVEGEKQASVEELEQDVVKRLADQVAKESHKS